MKNRVEAITIFFFGSPDIGFSSFPKTYRDRVISFDKGETNHSVECYYSIKPNKSIIRYCEYGLTGVSRSGSKRGGRNFGIWIELQNWMITEEGHQEIMPFLEQVNQVFVETLGAFDILDGVKHYKINSFGEIENELNELITICTKNLINDLGGYMVSIENGESARYNLIPREEEISPKPEADGEDYPDDEQINVEVKAKPKRRTFGEQLKIWQKSIKGKMSMTNTLLMLLLILSVAMWFKESIMRHKFSNRLANRGITQLAPLSMEEIQDLNPREIRYLAVLLLKNQGQPLVLDNDQLVLLNRKQAGNILKGKFNSDDEIIETIAQLIGEIESKETVKKIERAFGMPEKGNWDGVSKTRFLNFFKNNHSGNNE